MSIKDCYVGQFRLSLRLRQWRLSGIGSKDMPNAFVIISFACELRRVFYQTSAVRGA
ncbi:hypothetical protein [Shimia thalassica]|uniref:hypothetical protein n=1 Tax=Shimia thalassica TaxID=1715693 RepID=UPI0026E395DC|nr:hypothetical protein [Shimia thalassica]MDO6482005.1 hypothetical protein [Shimia thalassica]